MQKLLQFPDVRGKEGCGGCWRLLEVVGGLGRPAGGVQACPFCVPNLSRRLGVCSGTLGGARMDPSGRSFWILSSSLALPRPHPPPWSAPSRPQSGVVLSEKPRFREKKTCEWTTFM